MYCECGCGGLAPISPYNYVPMGYVKGKPRRFIAGHHSRLMRKREYRREDRGFETPCWIWLGRKHIAGYGRCWHDGVDQLAHRVFYVEAHGPVPAGLEVDHRCGNRLCVNPDHLEAVTHLENVRRGRGTKLTPADIEAICEAEGTQREIAKRFGIRGGYVCRLRNGHRPKYFSVSSGS